MLQVGRRQHPHTFSNHFNESSSTSPSHPTFLDHLPHTGATPSPASFYSQYAYKTYFDPSIPPVPTSVAGNVSDNSYMTTGLDYSNPSIRVQQSTPVPSATAQQSMLVDTRSGHNGWTGYDSGAAKSNTLQTPTSARRHRRAPSSSSSVDGMSTASVYTNSAGYQPVTRADVSPAPSTAYPVESSRDDESKTFSKHLPTPTQTPTQDSFLAPAFQNFNPQLNPESTIAANLAMKQAVMEQTPGFDDDTPSLRHSGRHSVSSYGQSPATPRTVYEDYGDERFKLPSNDVLRHNVPKFERTMSDIYSDELYNPLTAAPPPPAQNPSLLSPFRTVINELINQANEARSQSPASSVSRAVSPFRNGSPLAPESPHTRLGSTSGGSVRHNSEAEAMAMSGQQDDESPKTISPKDALLDYNETPEDAKMPLFSDGDGYDARSQLRATSQNAFDASSGQSYNGMTENLRSNWDEQQTSNTSNLPQGLPAHSNYQFAPPSIPAAAHGLPFSTQQYCSTANMSSAPEPQPEFPAHLTTMESSASEAAPENSSQETGVEMTKPANSLADGGTYTCTYHNCTRRFETPAKLQKHKREDHRQNPPSSSLASEAVGSGMTSAALLARNSQAGPHRCDRINPSTGKPCNTIFSRPYDLTRHEDTIHNARKQKVRCGLCVEEKTFSRNDALTRHMRVVHPEVDFPGKHRRRGGHSD